MSKKNDINIKICETNFCCRACAVITNGEKILFQKRKNDLYWALPGGKIEVGETTKDAIKREISEELAITNIEVGSIISITENFFKMNDVPVHQYIFTHKVDLPDFEYANETDAFPGAEKDKDIIYKWIKKSELGISKLKPDYIKDQLSNLDENIKFNTCIEE